MEQSDWLILVIGHDPLSCAANTVKSSTAIFESVYTFCLSFKGCEVPVYTQQLAGSHALRSDTGHARQAAISGYF